MLVFNSDPLMTIASNVRLPEEVEVIIHALRKIKPAAGMTLNIGEVLIDSINHPSFMLGGALCKARGQVTFENVIHQANAQFNIQLQLQLNRVVGSAGFA